MPCTLTVDQCNQLVELADQHQKADEYISGSYEEITGGKWEGGCAIGCTIHDARELGILPADTHPASHAAIAEASGVPQLLWRLADTIFEGLPQTERATFTPALLRTIRPGVDYSLVWPQLSIFVLLDVRPNAQPDGQAAIDQVIALHRRTIAGETVPASEFAAEAESAAWSAASESAFTRYRDAFIRLMAAAN